jgi:hypothetical protein
VRGTCEPQWEKEAIAVMDLKRGKEKVEEK